MTRLAFRSRLFGILLLFAVVPALLLTVGWGVLANKALQLVGAGAAWENLAESGKDLVGSLSSAPLSPGQRAQVEAHARELEESVTQARRLRFLSERMAPPVLLGGVLVLALLGFAASRVAGHLSRQLSRPVDQLVGWTSMIARGESLPEAQPERGAPEFNVLRAHMRTMASELAMARERELEAERLRAFRESARRVAHELKNPLTPIRFALARIQRDAPNELHEPIDVIRVETERLETLARSFAQFGRLPEGPAAEIDVEEMVRYTARTSVPPSVHLSLDVAPDLPCVSGHYDALQRALANVLLNAVEACAEQPAPRIGVRVGRERRNGHEAVTIAVRDSGVGIPAERLATIWEPYVTHKPGGTGLGLAIVRQIVEAHGGTVGVTSNPGEVDSGSGASAAVKESNGDAGGGGNAGSAVNGDSGGSGTEVRFSIPLNGNPTRGD